MPLAPAKPGANVAGALQIMDGDISRPIGYPLLMPFRTTDLHDLEIAREVRIETHAPRGGDVHSTIVWVVVDGGEVFVRSVRGERGRWYREAMAHHNVTVDDDGRRLETVAIPAADPETIRRVDAAINRKYANDPGHSSMLTPEAQKATLRLEPRTPGEDALQAPAYLGSVEPFELHGHPIELGIMDSGAPIEADVYLQPRKPA
ncbi:MAG: DUF2255 family protein [Chloroflexi bacterium]|nr:DUF2255 family protein [Chloroflexota bacterium]